MAHQPMPCHVSLEGLCTVCSLLSGIPSPSRRRPAAVTPRRWQITPTGGRRGMETVRAQCASIRARGARFPDGPAGCRSTSSSAQHEDPIGQWQTWTSVD
uniref:Uncharacterized protein n=1 Tax=Oryza glumipatula TaxID=40148 RepID=A0A0D9Y2Y9_9ORYZ